MGDVFSLMWEASNDAKCTGELGQLKQLTKSLMETYESQGRLSEDPLAPSKRRELSLPTEDVSEIVGGKVCLVTGGLGCVGSRLVKELLVFSPKKVIVIDVKEADEELFSELRREDVVVERGSILDTAFLKRVYRDYLPTIVFHTAAQRNPGLAEKTIGDTLRTNILGTWNVLLASSESDAVQRVVFSSTGKASRYYTEEVYAASKKVCEMLMDYFAVRFPNKLFSMVRFTHIVDNSLMDAELKRAAMQDDRIQIHSPGKFVTAQNVGEAAYLMLNALVFAEAGRSSFLLVKNLEWPVESLEVALYYIKQSKREVPILFVGNPKGYGEKFFRGQLDWSQSWDLNLLINVYENRIRRTNPENDIIISNLMPFDEVVLLKLVGDLQDTAYSDESLMDVLVSSLRAIFRHSLKLVDKKITLDILKWGIDPKFMHADGVKIGDFGEMVPMMLDSLEISSDLKKIQGL
ncbi:polysaccharide biosynthesis protein [Lunatimonas lonarensis]|nr:polysaccharide biosynthesis protein [Lunatimonas lonarensis]